MPDIQYPILYWSFHEGPNETVGSKGIAAFRHCADASSIDPAFDGVVEEVHTCPNCGYVASRQA